MAASCKDYSFSTGGALLPDWPLLYGKVHSDLLAWLEAANQQNPSQQLQLIAGPWHSPDPCGWTLKAQLEHTFPNTWPAEQLRGQPVELLSSWTFSSPSRFSHHYGLAADWSPPVAGGTAAGGTAAGGSVHGSPAQLWGSTDDYRTGTSYLTDLPVHALVVSSLDPGAEFFAFAHWEWTGYYRNLTPLLISKDQVSAQWLLLGAPAATSETVVGISWNRRAERAVRVQGLSARGAAPVDSGLFRAPTRAMPALQISGDPAAVVHYERVLLPAGLRTGSPGLGSWVLGPDGSGWLGIGAALMACLQDPQLP